MYTIQYFKITCQEIICLLTFFHHSLFCIDYQIIADKHGVISRLKIKLDYRDGMHDTERLKNLISEAIHKGLGVESEIKLVPQGSIASTSKAIRFVKVYE